LRTPHLPTATASAPTSRIVRASPPPLISILAIASTHLPRKTKSPFASHVCIFSLFSFWTLDAFLLYILNKFMGSQSCFKVELVIKIGVFRAGALPNNLKVDLGFTRRDGSRIKTLMNYTNNSCHRAIVKTILEVIV